LLTRSSAPDPSEELIHAAGLRDPGVWRETEVIDHLQERILQIDKHDV